MKKIAIIYPEFSIGGTATSLIFLLNSLDYTKISVDLLVYKEEGELLKKINPNVNVIALGLPISKLYIFFIAFFSGKLFLLFFRTIFRKNFYQHFRRGISQIGAFYRAKKTKRIDNKYDLAIGFMEFWANEFLQYVDARKKNMIIHPNYESACFNVFLDRHMFEHVDNISFVSLLNCESFNSFTKNIYSSKVLYFPNLLNKQTILDMSLEEIDNFAFNSECIFVTSARITSYVKGFDRMIDVALELVKNRFEFKWLVVGSGPDEKFIKKRIEHLKLNERFVFVGQQTNPYKYIKLANYFILLSRREGRPMSVDEAILLEKRCIVTSYETAKEQIKNSEYGLIVANNNFSAKTTADLICRDFLNIKENNRKIVQDDWLIQNQNIVKKYIYGK